MRNPELMATALDWCSFLGLTGGAALLIAAYLNPALGFLTLPALATLLASLIYGLR